MGGCQSYSSIQSKQPIAINTGSVNQLKMTNYLPLGDYQGLFDYQSHHLEKRTYHISTNCLVFCQKEHKVIKQTKEEPFDEEIMKAAAFQIIKHQNYFKIRPIYLENQEVTIQRLMWLIVRSVPNHKYPLRERDLLKFGKQKVRVREIVSEDIHSQAIINFNAIKTSKIIYQHVKFQKEQEGQLKHQKSYNLPQLQSIPSQTQKTCRICLEPGQFNNPLICPCKCIGSVRFIHLLCLRQWLGKQLNVSRNSQCITIGWTPLTCQVCKCHYKYRIYLDNQKYYTVEIPKPNKPYIVLQVLKKNECFSKILHFVSFADLQSEQSLKIGRHKQVDIRISEDISVSRYHAHLSYDSTTKKIYLQDNKSKFGTSVMIKKNLVVNPKHKNISFQMKGELYSFQCSRGTDSPSVFEDKEEYLDVRDKDEEVSSSQSSDENNNQQFEDHLSQGQDQIDVTFVNFSSLNNIATSHQLDDIHPHRHLKHNQNQNVPIESQQNRLHSLSRIIAEPVAEQVGGSSPHQQ